MVHCFWTMNVDDDRIHVCLAGYPLMRMQENIDYYFMKGFMIVRHIRFEISFEYSLDGNWAN